MADNLTAARLDRAGLFALRDLKNVNTGDTKRVKKRTKRSVVNSSVRKGPQTKKALPKAAGGARKRVIAKNVKTKRQPTKKRKPASKRPKANKQRKHC